MRKVSADQLGTLAPSAHPGRWFPAPGVAHSLRNPFEGELVSRFAMDVGEEKGHGCGTIAARWIDASTIEVALRPAAPRWLADRPMTTTIRYADGTATVATNRSGDPTTSGSCP